MIRQDELPSMQSRLPKRECLFGLACVQRTLRAFGESVHYPWRIARCSNVFEAEASGGLNCSRHRKSNRTRACESLACNDAAASRSFADSSLLLQSKQKGSVYLGARIGIVVFVPSPTVHPLRSDTRSVQEQRRRTRSDAAHLGIHITLQCS